VHVLTLATNVRGTSHYNLTSFMMLVNLRRHIKIEKWARISRRLLAVAVVVVMGSSRYDKILPILDEWGAFHVINYLLLWTGPFVAGVMVLVFSFAGNKSSQSSKLHVILRAAAG